MLYCFKSGRFHPNPRTKHISDPPRHMTKPYVSDFNMISHIIDTRIQHLIQLAYKCLKYNTTAEDTCLSTYYNQCLVAKVKHTMPTSTRVQVLRRGPLASRRRVFARRPEEEPSSSTEVQDRSHNVREERRKG